MDVHWLTRQQAAALALVSPQTIDAWRRRGLKSTKIGNVVRIHRDDLNTFMHQQQTGEAA